MKVGIFIFPNNCDIGTLEDLLLEGGYLIYSDLLQHAKDYIEQVRPNYQNRWSISDEKKVLVGCMTNVLKPEKANQVSIQDDK